MSAASTAGAPADPHVAPNPAPEHAPEAGGGAPEAATIRDLQARLRGEVLRPGEDGYDAARAVWNAAVDRRPAVVVRAAARADVAAVSFARERDLRLSVRGGGHDVAGHAVADRGLMLDLSRHDRDPGRPRAAHRPRRARAHLGRSSTARRTPSAWPPPARSSPRWASPA